MPLDSGSWESQCGWSLGCCLLQGTAGSKGIVCSCIPAPWQGYAAGAKYGSRVSRVEILCAELLNFECCSCVQSISSVDVDIVVFAERGGGNER